MIKKFVATLSLTTLIVTALAMPTYAMGRGMGRGMGCGGGGGYRYNNISSSTTAYDIQALESLDVEAILAQRKVYFDSLVAIGAITQEQADIYIANCRTMLEYRAANGFGSCGGYGGGGACVGLGGGYGINALSI